MVVFDSVSAHLHYTHPHFQMTSCEYLPFKTSSHICYCSHLRDLDIFEPYVNFFKVIQAKSFRHLLEFLPNTRDLSKPLIGSLFNDATDGRLCERRYSFHSSYLQKSG